MEEVGEEEEAWEVVLRGKTHLLTTSLLRLNLLQVRRSFLEC